MKQRPICLASASPRRKTLLTDYGITVITAAAAIDETAKPNELPERYVSRLALDKASAVKPHYPEHLVLAADTTVAIHAELLGKPRDSTEIRTMLKKLSNTTHTVWSAYCILTDSEQTPLIRTTTTEVTFRTLPCWWIDWYAEHADVYDKAGGYGIQEWGGLMVEQIKGSYTNVMGLPVEKVFWDLIRLQWLSI